MVKRKVIQIDEEKCNGCGLCIPACHEGAIQIVNGKAKLVADKYCDGLGDCLGECPLDAITIVEREAAAYDEEAVRERLKDLDRTNNSQKAGCPSGQAACPGAITRDLTDTNPDRERNSIPAFQASEDLDIQIKSRLENWPVQLKLVPEKTPGFDGADLLVAADCVPVASPYFHLRFLKGRKAVIGCPKLDNLNHYYQKLTAILGNNKVNSLTVAIMEVPCCSGLVQAVRQAIRDSGSSIPLQVVRVNIDGSSRVIESSI
ncbi:MAG: 4Fe-4S dicluster domain-containing protein [Halanaerobium sp.]|nr:4Fe-4S dicluster domain-containing protein [Halanaerobium sp.]